MRNARIAEWFLSLVTTPDRAAAAVGDLLEVHSPHGSVRFWVSVVATLCAHIWGDLAAHPIRMAGLAVQGILLQLLFSVAMAIGLALLYGVISAVALQVGARDPGLLSGWWVNPAPWLVSGSLVAGWIFALVGSYLVGRILARQSPGHELAPCVANVIMGFVLPYVVFGSLGWPRGEPMLTAPGPWWPMFAYSFPPFVALMAGAIRVRRLRRSVSS